MDSLAITDHGVMYGAIQFYLEAIEAGIKPIIGCEVYLAQDNRFGREGGEKNYYHLVLLARDQEGYHNLIQLTTKAHLEGFYYRPRVDRELLEQFCMGGLMRPGRPLRGISRPLVISTWKYSGTPFPSWSR